MMVASQTTPLGMANVILVGANEAMGTASPSMSRVAPARNAVPVIVTTVPGRGANGEICVIVGAGYGAMLMWMAFVMAKDPVAAWL